MKNFKDFKNLISQKSNPKVNESHFRAIFVTGGPGSGKDIVIRESLSHFNIMELNIVQLKKYILDKQRFATESDDHKLQSLRNRKSLIINCPADDSDSIMDLKEELEEFGYETMLIFVSTTNEISKKRNEYLAKSINESIRYEKWSKSQENKAELYKSFDNFITFDNSGDISSKTKDINKINEMTKIFLNSKVLNEASQDWIDRNNINKKINTLFKENKNDQENNKLFQETKDCSTSTSSVGKNHRGCGKHKFIIDNNCPSCQMARIAGKQDDVRYGDTKANPGGYTFRTYEEIVSETSPTLKISPKAKEPNFQKDNDKNKKIKRGDKSLRANRVGNPDGLGSEWNTRTNGSGLTGGAGLGNIMSSESQDYSNASPASTASPAGGLIDPMKVDREKPTFIKLRKKLKNEAIDSPTVSDMGVSGTMSGASNKEGMNTYSDTLRNIGVTIKKNNKKGAK